MDGLPSDADKVIPAGQPRFYHREKKEQRRKLRYNLLFRPRPHRAAAATIKKKKTERERETDK